MHIEPPKRATLSPTRPRPHTPAPHKRHPPQGCRHANYPEPPLWEPHDEPHPPLSERRATHMQPTYPAAMQVLLWHKPPLRAHLQPVPNRRQRGTAQLCCPELEATRATIEERALLGGFSRTLSRGRKGTPSRPIVNSSQMATLTVPNRTPAGWHLRLRSLRG